MHRCGIPLLSLRDDCVPDFSLLSIFMNYYRLQHSIPTKTECKKASEMSELQPGATGPRPWAQTWAADPAFHRKSRIQKIRAVICWSRETHIWSYMHNGLIKQLEANAERRFSVFAIFHRSDPITNLNQSQPYWQKWPPAKHITENLYYFHNIVLQLFIMSHALYH